MLPLEDNFNDIIGKALRGLKISESEAAEKAGLEQRAVRSLLDGEFDEAAIRRLAPILGLSPDALAASGQKSWRPESQAIDGLAQFTTPWDDMMVNSYLAWDPSTRAAVAFDTGADCSPMLELIQGKQLDLQVIAITHTHGDHIFDLDRLKEKTGARAIVSSQEPHAGTEPISAGYAFRAGSLAVSARSTWGHSVGGLSYVISGLSKPVAVVGDAIFAGSMGGGMVSYDAALRTNRDEILSLPPETVLCPGHGPLSTVGEELQHNPFFAGVTAFR